MLEGRAYYLDNLYQDQHVCIELDGRGAHPDDRRWIDVRRDNALAALGLITLRYGWADVGDRSCRTAGEIGAVLAGRGWSGSVRPCGPRCPLARPRSLAS
jgi:very-short-patch-repair endonuclease